VVLVLSAPMLSVLVWVAPAALAMVDPKLP
jgi:hypothetical protein